MKSGITLSRSLEVLETQAEDRSLGTAAAHLRRSIGNGATFSQALSLFPHIFSKFRRSIVKAGEEGGSLDESLLYLAGIAEKEHQLRNKVINALTYPIFVTSVALIAGLLLLKFLYPSLRVMISDLGLKLPFYSRCVITVIDNLSRLYIIIPIATVLYILAKKFHKYIFTTMQGMTWGERCLFAIPALGELLKKSVVTHVMFTLAALMKAGIKLTRALELASETCDSVLIGRAVNQISASVLIRGKGKHRRKNLHRRMVPRAFR